MGKHKDENVVHVRLQKLEWEQNTEPLAHVSVSKEEHYTTREVG